MAQRPVYIAGKTQELLVKEEKLEFKWYAGMAKSQKQKSVHSLHNSFKEKYPELHILEISTSSEEEIGFRLSAFNLQIVSKNADKLYSLEAVFQASKKFSNGGPYKDIINKSPIEAKKDIRLKESGDLQAFVYKGKEWPLEPKTLFYDWLYLNTVNQSQSLVNELIKYDAFTDIEFNPKKSINCQARSAALFVALYRLGLLEKVLADKDQYIKFMSSLENIQEKIGDISK